jgi:hypothetical protein
MDCATSATVTGAANSRREPSGSVIWIIEISFCEKNKKRGQTPRFAQERLERPARDYRPQGRRAARVVEVVRGVITESAFLALVG